MKKQAIAEVSQIRQTTQYSCCAASIAAALKAHGKNITEEELNQVLGAAPMAGASWESMLATVQYFGLRGSLVVPATPRMLKKWTDAGIPVVIAWNPENRPWSHASTVFDVVEGPEGLMIHVMDPNIPNPSKTTRVMGEDEFCQKWGEKISDSLIMRRPAMAVEREITPEGRQMVASKTAALKKMQGVVQRISGGGHSVAWDDQMSIKIDNMEYVAGAGLVKLLKVGDVVVFYAGSRDPFLHLPTALDLYAPRELNKTAKPETVAPARNPYERERGTRNWGAGGHNTKTRDVAKGISRKPKHKNDWDKEAEKVADRFIQAQAYSGNPDGKPIYPNEIDHGVTTEPVAGGTDIMRKLQNQLLHEQGTDDLMREDSPRLAAAWDSEDTPDNDYRACIAYLNANAVKFPRKSGWWIPAHNLAVNMTLGGSLGLRQFSVLPWTPKRFAYKPATEDHPEGIVLRPQWHMLNDPQLRNEFEGTAENAKYLLDLIETRPTVGETLKAEFKWLEQTFHIDVPGDIVAHWVQQAPKIAVQRWGVDTLRMKDRFVPLDGSKPVEMDSLGTPRRASQIADRFLAKKGV